MVTSSTGAADTQSQREGLEREKRETIKIPAAPAAVMNLLPSKAADDTKFSAPLEWAKVVRRP
jgi:hypothetical protein